MNTGRYTAHLLLAAALMLGFADSTTAQTGDYLPPDLRSRVDQLKASFEEIPTDATNAAARAQLTWQWVNAHALSGAYVPVNSTQIIASILAGGTSPPLLAALNASIAELAFVDNFPNGLGSLQADTGPFTAGEFAAVKQTYTVGEKAIQTGGAFMLARHFMTNFGTWQTSDPNAPNYISIQSSNAKVSFVATTTPLNGMHGGFRSFRETLTFRVASGTLQPGDQVVITWGDRSQGSPGMQMATMSSDRMPLPVYVSFGREQQFFSLPIQPIRVIGSSIAGVAGFAPSILAPGETFEFSIRARDAYYNRATGNVPDWQLLIDDKPWLTVPADGAITQAQASFDKPGVYYIAIASADGTVQGSFNPVWVQAEPRQRIFWGDTHGHSGFAEGIGSAERFMQWARDDARLDYVTHSEHDIWLDDHEWEVLRDIVQSYTEDGKFVAYLGYEWTAPNQRGGHHNVLFRTPQNRQRVPIQFFPTLSQLYAGLRGAADPEDVVVIPHAHQAGDYRQSDPQLEPLIEIMSQHGNFEWFGRMYLQHGHQVGFTAASDNHLSQPGYSAPLGGSLSQRGGLGAIMAPQRSVDAIFDGMRNLQSYATTGDRIIVDFSLNGVGMGQRAPFDRARQVQARVIGTAPIDTVTLFKNDQPVWEKSYYATDEATGSKTENLLLTFASDSAPINPLDNPRGWRAWEGTLRVSNADLVSIQPVDASFPLQTVDTSDMADNKVTFATKSRGDGSSYLVKLKNVQRSARLQFDLIETGESGGAPPIYRPQQRVAADSFSLALRDMKAGTLSHSQPVDAYTDRVTLRRVVEQGTRQVDINFSDSGELQGDYYYLRVVQANDAIAWSSPIWVGGHPSR